MKNRATWELQRIIKALSKCALLNTPDETERLNAAKKELHDRRNDKKKGLQNPK